MQFPNARILIFSRLPRVGRVKTRLIPLLGDQGACEFHAACLELTLRRILDSGLAPVELWLDRDPGSDPGLLPAVARDCPVRVQSGRDLGQRMAHAISSAKAGGPTLLVGTDVPLLDGGYLEPALLRLAGKEVDVVMGPAEDGGYVLLGLRRARPQLFRDMPWGGDHVAAITRERCRRLGLNLCELQTLWDLDRPEDIARLCGRTEQALHELQALACQHLPRL